MTDVICCTPKQLPRQQWVNAARIARSINPVNHPALHRLRAIDHKFNPSVERIAVVTTKYWHTNGVRLTVGFLDNPPSDLRARIISHMNAWSESANVSFTESSSEPQVRITRAGGSNGGYWSYVGTDILSIDASQPTMNLEGFTMTTEDSEFHRVVRHETGHTLGCPHEHMRKELVDLIDVKKAIKYFGQTQGWSPEEVRQQVLTPIEESSLLGTDHADPDSIMCYQIPGTVTKSGKPIVGGIDIDPEDFGFMAKIYPKAAAPTAGSSQKPAAGAAAPGHGDDQVARLTADLDVLKKAIAILARSE
jgi:hypothetical protein